MRILYVENHAVFAATVVSEFLHEHDVVVVRTCADALARASQFGFDAALVDYDLDDGTGDSVVRALRVRGFRGRIIAVSAHEEGNAALAAAGADAICPKAGFRALGRLLCG